MKSNQVYVKKSNINGMGTFASKNFKKGEIVLVWDISNTLTNDIFDKLTEREKKYVSFLDGKHVIMQEPEKFVNHSCSPNTTAKNFCDVAIKNIKKDEEITADYSEELPPNTKMKCECKSINCKKIIKSIKKH